MGPERKGNEVIIPEVKIGKDLEADVVVIGGGGAGVPAALSALEEGAKSVIVVDKRFATGGDALRANWIFAVESHLQKEAGVTITRDDIYKKALEWHRYDRVNPRILRALVNKTADTIHWLEEKGVEFELRVMGDPKTATAHWTTATPAGLCSFGWVYRLITQKCAEAGVQFLLRASGKKILRGANGNVTGVLVGTRDGQEIEIKTRSVILCPGSFIGNRELLKQYFPYYYDENTYHTDALLSNTGDGIQMAADAGAALADFVTLARHAYAGDTVVNNRCHQLGQPTGIRVNKRGQRYLSESVNDIGGNVFIQQPGKIAYHLYDDKVVQGIVEQGRPPQGPRIPLPSEKIPDFRQHLQELAEQGVWTKISDTWDEIAEWIGCDQKVLKTTIDRYNSFCDQGYDEDFAKDKQYLIPLRTPPYYAIQFRQLIGQTHGPVIVNEHMEVLDKEDNPIPGFYAAGEVTSGWVSYDYGGTPGGTALGFSIGSGRIAGENAAKYVLGK